MPNLESALSLGLDFGTSGARAIVIDGLGQVVSQACCDYPAVDSLPGSLRGSLSENWQSILWELLRSLPVFVRQCLKSISIDGTSATVLLCDRNGQSITEPILYNDDRGQVCLDTIRAFAPADSPTRSATSSLAKALWWHRTLSTDQLQSAQYLMHQADWLAFLLHGQSGVSDYHNALKLGYDVGGLRYPDWLLDLPMAQWYPKVVEPGSEIANIQPHLSEKFSIPPDCVIRAGTTDSIAAFLASGAQRPGDAVTSLGSTLVLKLLSTTRVDASPQGIYSHRFGDLWLVGGASNTGGAVLRHYFDDPMLQALSAQIDPSQSSNLDYYPLLSPGERFPINDPQYLPRLTPRPENPATFLQGLLEGMARIESQGYQTLVALGSSPLLHVWTAGGGAQNLVWQTIRQRCLGVPTKPAHQTEAAYGAACLAQWGLPQLKV